MNLIKKITKYTSVALIFGSAVAGCQKMERPELKELILDPPPPPYSILKSLWSFENNVRDTGQYRLASTAKNITYVAGITGQAAQIGTDGYILIPTVADSVKTLGSFTIAFWMKGVGPVQGGAQGLFAIGNKKEFWGNIEMFLENLNNGSEAFLKLHMYNADGPTRNKEEWTEVKIANGLNKWTHIVVTYSAATSHLSIFADGAVTAINNKVLGGGTFGPIKFNDVNGMVLGNFQFETDPSLTTSHGKEDWARGFNGALDQFRIYNVALTPAEVTALFNSKL